MLMENIMNGNYWFIPLSLLMTVLSCMSYFYFAYKDYEDDSEQIRYVTVQLMRTTKQYFANLLR